MEPKDYFAALCRRWVWIGVAAFLGASLGFGIGLSSPAMYRSSTSLYVGVADAHTSAEIGAGLLIDQRILPSLVSLARTGVVLAPVVEELHLGMSPAELAADVQASVLEDTSVVQIDVLAPTAGRAQRTASAVATHLQEAARELYRASGHVSPLQVSTVDPASLPSFQAVPNKKRDAALGLGAGAAVAVLLIGLRELFRPMIRGAGGVSRVTSVPAVDVYAHDRAPRRGFETHRERSLNRLWWLLHESPAVGGGGRVAIVGNRAEELARELEAAGSRVLYGPLAERHGAGGSDPTARLVDAIDVHPVADLAQLRAGEPFDGLVVAADSGRTSIRALSATLTTAGQSGTPLVGVVVDRVQPPQASIRRRLLAALRGNAGARTLDAWTRARYDADGRLRTSSRVVAVAALVLSGLALPVVLGTTTALYATMALLPVWLRPARRYRGTAILGVLTAVALLSGVFLAAAASADHAVTMGNSVRTASLMLSAAGTVGLVLWARTILPLRVVGLAYGLGFLATGVLRSPASVNAMKFELLLPIAIVVLSLLVPSRTVMRPVLALAALGLVSIVSDARSIFSFCVVAVALLLWQARSDADPRKNRWMGVLALAGAGTGIYFAVSELLVSGALGAELQTRTTQQITQSGSLLLGGRPEWTATWALMRHYPMGFGLGTVPDAQEVLVGKTGFAVTHIPSGNHYIETYLFDGRFELHSIVADLWVQLGPAGLLLGLVAFVLVVRSLVDALGRRAAPALACFLALAALWYLAFGPIESNLMDVAFALGVLLVPLGTRGDAHAHPLSAERPARVDPVGVGT